MNGFLDTLRGLGALRLSLLGGVAIGLVSFFLFFASRLNAPSMSLLFSDLSPQDSGQIAAKLDAQAVPFELRAGGAQIYVPADRALRLRMGLAEQGLPRGGSIGYELFDRSDAIGATSFVQNLNQVRALEGELTRTITTLSAVAGARVHLVIPRRELFARDRQEPTASVVLKLRGANRLSPSQVKGIQYLVAAAVPSMKPTRVSILDDDGTLLARGQAEGEDPAAASGNSEEQRRAFEQRLARTIEELLERTAGPGKVRVEVSAQMDFDRIVTTTEAYDPEGQVVRSTQTVSESSDSAEGAQGGQVSASNNLPDAEAANGGKSASRSTRSEETVNYEITRTTRNQVREAGNVKQLSIAVLIDGTSSAGADGQRSYKPRSEEEMQRLTALVRTAAGFNEKRGDTLEVVNLPFTGAEAPAPSEAAAGMFDLTKQDYFRLAELAVLSIVAILVILLVARPMISYAFARGATAAPRGAGGGPAMLENHSGGGPAALAPPTGGGEARIAPGGGDDASSHQESMIDIGRVDGRVKASSIKKIGEIVDKHPEEAVAIMRNWMYQQT
ncbi:MAG: flagellar M-ring protein FliF [Proteobacteria bacterium]|nr:flagellar M-ring protein FliF [Pseudomonadota bacterium]